MTDPRCFVVVCEADADRVSATRLADRRLGDALERAGRSRDELEILRRWDGEPTRESYFRWGSVKRRADELGIKVHGHFQGEPGAPDAQQAARALYVLLRRSDRPDAVILMRDSDSDMTRRRGLEQARDRTAWPFRVVIGIAHPMREAWILAGFVAEGPEEEELLAQVKAATGFDPCERPHDLTAKSRSPGTKHSPKTILAALARASFERECACLDATWRLLERRGRQTGLPEYLREIDETLVPLIP